MIEINRRALYNALRMNWVLDPTLDVEPWQVEDYRVMPSDMIFEKLEDYNIPLDKNAFLAFADTVDTPEDLVDVLLDDAVSDTKMQDHVYLLVFELWRRLLPERPSLSIFCDEIDYQIHLYDRGQIETVEALQDALANLQVLLDENTDEGADPVEAFEYLDSGCANDIESFLYNYIAEQIDHHNLPYATELLDGFGDYMPDIKWFEFLRARLIAPKDPVEANQLVQKLLGESGYQRDLEFNLEMLSFLVVVGDRETFEKLTKQTAEMLEIEEDFQNLVAISADFYHRLDHENIEQALQNILNQRLHCDLNKTFNRKDAVLSEFFKIIGR